MASIKLTAFCGSQKIASGEAIEVWRAVAAHSGASPADAILVFDDATGRIVDLDPRNPPVDSSQPKGRGRPRLGVVSREVTLLPRQWDFLNAEPGGASAALRRLVDEERRRRTASGDPRARQASAYTFMTAIAGDFENYEEALRALFAADRKRFAALVRGWPADIRNYALHLGFAQSRDKGMGQ